MSSSSDEEALDDLEFEGNTEPDDEIEDDILGALEEDLAAEAEEAEEVHNLPQDIACANYIVTYRILIRMILTACLTTTTTKTTRRMAWIIHCRLFLCSRLPQHPWIPPWTTHLRHLQLHHPFPMRFLKISNHLRDPPLP